MTTFRTERDTMGEIRVPADKYWGAQTQRSLEHFAIGSEKIPGEIIRAFAYLKKAAALANRELGKLDPRRAELIADVCDEILSGKLEGNFPLAVWQTGSGTHTNMNLNEVIANRGNELAGEKLLHPNDHVNCSQSSNDTFPSAMRVAFVLALQNRLIPALEELSSALAQLEENNQGIVKAGRTHLQDAVPILFSQEISGWRAMTEKSASIIMQTLPALAELPLGGTAVGTGLNAPEGFDKAAAAGISRLCGAVFTASDNKFHGLTSMDACVASHGAVKAAACDLLKIANDVRFLAGGPRCGLGELSLPANEPGSSIMPGKVNPTQCEALTMVAAQVMANDSAVSFAASQGHFELNVYQPLCAYNFLQSVGILSDAIHSFRIFCVDGITVNRSKMEGYANNSLMLVTSLAPRIGYDKAARTAKKALAESISLAEAAEALGFLSREEALAVLDPLKMV